MLLSGLKAALASGAITGGINAGISIVSSLVQGDDIGTIIGNSLNAFGDGFAGGFMIGGIMAGTSMALSSGFRMAGKLGARAGRRGGGKYSAFGEMSDVDGMRYNQWMKLREGGLDQAKINEIILTNKGLRPNPNTYLSQTYINNHLNQFNGGVTRIMTQAPKGTAGPPGGTFAMSSSVADDLIVQAGGDVSKLEKLLSLESGSLGTSPVRVDVKNPTNIRIPSGNELGANSQWLPGGYTGGGIPEVTITSPKPGEYIVNPIN